MKFRASLVGLALLSGVLAPAAAQIEVACAAEGPQAALVVDTGSKVLGYCVALPSDSVSGIKLIQLASSQHGLSYRLGYGGRAVCMLAGVGSTEDECFAQGEPFWGYWHGNASGGWSWSSVGAADYAVEDGDVEGWSYGTGTTGSSHPPPRTAASFEAVCAEPDPEPTGGGSDDDGNGGGAKDDDNDGGDENRGGDDRTANEGDDSRDDPKPPEPREPRRDGDADRPPRSRPSPAGSPSGDSNDAVADNQEESEEEAPARNRDVRDKRGNKPPKLTATPSPAPTPTPQPTPTPALEIVERGDFEPADDGSGPPAAGVAGLGVALILGGAGVLVTRRRRRNEMA